MSDRVTARLSDLLTEAQGLGFIGPADLQPHLDHARGFIAARDRQDGPARVVDLGSGGGLPSLVLAEAWPAAEFWLIEANQRRVHFLAEAVVQLGWADRVHACNGRAETFGRTDELRASMDLVTARGFGPPAVTAECAAPFLMPGGQLIVSEPPESEIISRWPTEGLALLGMTLDRVVSPSPAHYAVVEQRDPCPDRYPRRVGIPAKRPLF